ncbi:hypothetical protein [Erythrobacter sp.]|uniref:hypothetical protein n=1 Tax=Erythrobacter sp. TaxID=1042 RepID=UPI001425EE98|nr:hypothetical protein [Erythrobacter sp.]QIQ87334.1 MAG: hypothetical protein G9473_12040 [Erythrobacter sp.]
MKTAPIAIIVASVGMVAAGFGPSTDRASLCGIAREQLQRGLNIASDETFVFKTRDEEMLINYDGDVASQVSRLRDFLENSDLPGLGWWRVRNSDPWGSAGFPMDDFSKRDLQALEAMLLDGPMKNAVTECSNVSDLLVSRGIAFGDDAVDAATDMDNRTYEHTVSAIYLPYIYENGTSALMFESRSWGWLAGAGQLLKLKKQPDGEWLVTNSTSLWVS